MEDRPPCTSDPELFFSERIADIDKAKDLCRHACAVRRANQCREEGWNHEYGIFGGLTQWDRERIDPARYRAVVTMANEASLAADEAAEARAKRDSGEPKSSATATNGRHDTEMAAVAALAEQGVERQLIGERLGMSERTVQRRLATARRILEDAA